MKMMKAKILFIPNRDFIKTRLNSPLKIYWNKILSLQVQLCTVGEKISMTFSLLGFFREIGLNIFCMLKKERLNLFRKLWAYIEGLPAAYGAEQEKKTAFI